MVHNQLKCIHSYLHLLLNIYTMLLLYQDSEDVRPKHFKQTNINNNGQPIPFVGFEFAFSRLVE